MTTTETPLQAVERLANEAYESGALTPMRGTTRGCALGAAYKRVFGRIPDCPATAILRLGLSLPAGTGVANGFDDVRHRSWVDDPDYGYGYDVGARLAAKWLDDQKEDEAL